MWARSPRPAADVIIELPGDRVVLVRRRNPPPGWALPGGFVDEGERVEAAALREAFEETGLVVEIRGLFHVYSDPSRDPRGHTLSVIYFGRADGEPRGGDDAAEARAFSLDDLPSPLAFDHAMILDDYRRFRVEGRRPLEDAPVAPPSLSAGERTRLLGLARTAIAARLSGEATPPAAEVAGVLAERRGVFVSLHRRGDGDLRGCIGTFAPERPLAEEVGAMAVAAAFDDPRFQPLERAELTDVEIEISVLSAPTPATPAEVVAGVHGVAVTCASRKGVFLPQVARQAGWDRDTLLAEVCRKAGLDPNAWRDPETALSIFTATVFAETSGRTSA